MVLSAGGSWRSRRSQRRLQALWITARTFEVILLTEHTRKGLRRYTAPPSPPEPAGSHRVHAWAACFSAPHGGRNPDIDYEQGKLPRYLSRNPQNRPPQPYVPLFPHDFRKGAITSLLITRRQHGFGPLFYNLVKNLLDTAPKDSVACPILLYACVSRWSWQAPAASRLPVPSSPENKVPPPAPAPQVSAIS